MLKNGDVKCISTHLTSFAILLSVTGKVSGSPEEEFALKLAGYIGCGISSICLIVTIIALPLLGYTHILVTSYHLIVANVQSLPTNR